LPYQTTRPVVAERPPGGGGAANSRPHGTQPGPDCASAIGPNADGYSREYDRWFLRPRLRVALYLCESGGGGFIRALAQRASGRRAVADFSRTSRHGFRTKLSPGYGRAGTRRV